MRNIIVFISLILVSFSLLAKRIEQSAEFIGVGQIKTRPDYIQVVFSVQSECYQTPLEAQNATDEVVKKLDNYLQQLKTEGDEHFKILVNGGYTSTFSKWHKDRELCRNTFQKTTEVIVKIGATEGFDTIFSEMQSYALKNFQQGFPEDFLENSRTYVRINEPSPQITKKTRTVLEYKALNLAMLDAKARLRATLRSCKDHQWKVLRIKEEESHVAAPRPYRFAQAKVMSFGAVQESSAPVRFDDLSVEKSLVVTFEFEGALCYEQ